MPNGFLHQPEWARTALNTAIGLYRKEHTKPGQTLVFIGGVHGDEPEGVRMAEDLLKWTLEATAHGEQLQPWLIVPDINPDGSAKKQRMNGRGVDLNRNFPSSDWSAEAKTPRYFPGPFPASEPEVQALVDLLVAEKPRLIVHFHSWEPCVVYTGAAGKPYADVIGASSGYESREDIGYPTPGSLGQYGALILKTPVICVEAQEHEKDLSTLWPRFGPGLQKILRGEVS